MRTPLILSIRWMFLLLHQSEAHRGRSTNDRAAEARERLRAMQKKKQGGGGGAAGDDDDDDDGNDASGAPNHMSGRRGPRQAR